MRTDALDTGFKRLCVTLAGVLCATSAGGMVLGMERSWHLVLMSEGTKTGQRKVLPHTSPTKSGDEPQLCGGCMHWTRGSFANSDNQMVLETIQHKLSATSGVTFK